MGIIGNLFGVLFGGGRNAVRETLEVFRPNAEAGAVRDAAREAASLAQFASEFAVPRRGWFDRLVDGLNRLPRPMLAFGVIGLFTAALSDPVWFAARMQGVALVPEPLWWLMGAIVSFYFGARHQVKTQDFQRGLAETLARTPQVLEHIRDLEALRPEKPLVLSPDDHVEAVEDNAPETASGNAALDEWRRMRGK